MLPILVLFFAWLLVSLILSLFSMFLAAQGVDIMSYGAVLGIQSTNQLLSFGLVGVLFVAYYLGDVRGSLGLRFSRRYWLALLMAVPALLALLPFTDVLTLWNDSFHLPGGVGSVIEGKLRSLTAQTEQILMPLLSFDDVPHLLLNLVVIAFLPALCEEIFFRCAMQQHFQRWFKSPHWAVFVTAAIFSLFHGDIFAFLPRFFLGVLLGYLFAFSGSILLNSMAHFANNAVIVVAYFLYARGSIAFNPVEPLVLHWLPTLLLTVVGALLLFLLWRKRRVEV